MFAAGLVARSVSEFIEVGWFPALVEHVWNLNPILSEESTLGQILGTLFGYNGSPSLMAVITYIAYFVAIWFGLRLVHNTENIPAGTQA